MTNINGTLVKKLRDRTGAGVIDCKNALTETQCWTPASGSSEP